MATMEEQNPKKLITLVEELGEKVLYSMSLIDGENDSKVKLPFSIEDPTGSSFISLGHKLYQIGGVDSFYKISSKKVFCYDTLHCFSPVPVPSLNLDRHSPTLLTLDNTIFACSIFSDNEFFLDIECLDTQQPHSAWSPFYCLKLPPLDLKFISYEIAAYASTPDALYLSISHLGTYEYRKCSGSWVFHAAELPFPGEGIYLDKLVYALPNTHDHINCYTILVDGATTSFKLVSSTDIPHFREICTIFMSVTPLWNDALALLRGVYDPVEDLSQVSVDHYPITQLTRVRRRPRRVIPTCMKKCRPGNSHLLRWFLIAE